MNLCRETVSDRANCEIKLDCAYIRVGNGETYKQGRKAHEYDIPASRLVNYQKCCGCFALQTSSRCDGRKRSRISPTLALHGPGTGVDLRRLARGYKMRL
jgi:hypothetical protein